MRLDPVDAASSTRSRARARPRRPRRAMRARRAGSSPAARARRAGRGGARASRPRRTGYRRPRPDQRDEIETAIGPDLGRPLLDRQRRAPVRVEFLLPRREHRALGVEDQPVEIEHQRLDVHRPSRCSCGSIGLCSETPPSAATTWPVTQSSVHSATTACATSAAVPNRPSAAAPFDLRAVAAERVGRGEHRRIGRSRGDRVHADAERAELARGGAHELREPGLRDRVVRHQRAR